MSFSYRPQGNPLARNQRKRTSDEQWVKEHHPSERRTRKRTFAVDAVDADPITSGRNDAPPADSE